VTDWTDRAMSETHHHHQVLICSTPIITNTDTQLAGTYIDSKLLVQASRQDAIHEFGHSLVLGAAQRRKGPSGSDAQLNWLTNYLIECWILQRKGGKKQNAFQACCTLTFPLSLTNVEKEARAQENKKEQS